jgi:hypothetical protein
MAESQKPKKTRAKATAAKKTTAKGGKKTTQRTLLEFSQSNDDIQDTSGF